MMSHSLESQIQEAIRLFQSGNGVAAIESLQDALLLDQNNKAVTGLLGCYLFDVGCVAEAIPILQRSVSLSPTSEMSARALHLALMRESRIEEAICELDRFIGATESRELRTEWQELRRATEEKETSGGRA